MLQDFALGLRVIRRNPAFAITAIATLALGIGGNSAMFTLLRAVVLKPLEYRDPDRLVTIEVSTPTRWQDMRPAAQSFSEIALFGMPERVTLTGGGEPEALAGARVSSNFLHVLGIEPLFGRGFLASEDTPGGAPVVMITAELWQRRFAGDSQVCGRIITLDSTPYTIIGVLPLKSQFPIPNAQVWLPRPEEPNAIAPPSRPTSTFLTAVARLKDGVTIDQARAELLVLTERYAKAHPGMLDADPKRTMRPQFLKERLVSNVRTMLWMLFGAVGFVLLIACANVASLLLARAESRSSEFAVRAALGAGRGRIVRQLLAENLVLATLGGGLGLALAPLALQAIQSMRAFSLPRSGEIRLDGVVLLFTIALVGVTGVLFGLVPALRASRPDLADALRASGERTAGVGPRRAVLSPRALLVTGQVALSAILLIGAALLIESLARLRAVNPGFRAEGVLTLKLDLPPARYPSAQQLRTFYDTLIQRVESTPGVRSAGLTMTLPMTGWAGTPVQRADQPMQKLNERPITVVQDVTPAYFRTLGIPLRRGREFDSRDQPGATPVAIINEAFARKLWPEYPLGVDPVGQRALLGSRNLVAEIVGIVGDVHESALDLEPRPMLYWALKQSPPGFAMLAVRSDGDAARLAPVVTAVVRELDRDLPVSSIRTMTEIVETSEGQRQLILAMLGLFAGIALVLALIGIYGTIAYAVAQRSRELAIRRALGAQRGDILRLVLSQGLTLALVGIAIGVGGALGLTRLLRDLLFGVSATDPLTFAAIGALFLATAAAATYIPARRASRIDPMLVLR
jgi:predicted permease